MDQFSFMVVASVALPFIVEILKKIPFVSTFDSKHLAIVVALVMGLGYSLATTYLSPAFLAQMTAISAVAWTVGTALYRTYKK